MCTSSTKSNSDQSDMHPTLILDDVSSEASAIDCRTLSSNINSTPGDNLLSEDQSLSTTLQAGEIRRKRKVDDISSVNVISRTHRSSKLSKAGSISSNAMESTQQIPWIQ